MSTTTLERPQSSPRSPVESTSEERVDRLLESLAQRKKDWPSVPLDERAGLLRQCIEGLLEVADEWVALACAAKRVDPSSSWAGEEWISGPMVTVRYLRLLAESLEAGGRPEPPAIRVGPDGQAIASVFPASTIDQVLYSGVSADVWIRPDRLPTQGHLYNAKRAGGPAPGGVALVLGAGNVGSIPATDLIYEMFVKDRVVLVKMNQVNDYLGPLLRRAFAPLVERGFVDFVYGGPDIGDYLCRHERVEAIHLTGSQQTYDAIVWGPSADERTRRKAAGQPRLDKPFTAELGCVTPVIVVPGRWSPAEIEFQARNVAAMVVHNASFNCTAAKLLVLPAGWRQRGEFLEAVKHALSCVPSRHAYYPGARKRYQAFLDRYPQSIALSGREADVPWTLIPNVPPRPGEYALCHEAFCGVLAEVRLAAGRAGDPASFLENAVRFVNESVWGTLSCAVLVSSAAQRALGDGLARAVAALRYGGIGINVWPGVLFGLGATTWGGFPGHTPQDIGSGVGVVHNSFLFDHPERSVAWSPSVVHPTPPWFAGHRNLATLGRRITRFEAAPSMAGLPGLALASLLG